MVSHGQISSGGGIEMPAFKIRQRMAMKIAAKKSAEGYQLSDDRCEFCEMQLFAMNGNVTCKVCPALQKLVQMKNNGPGDQKEIDDARDTTEIVGKDTESRDTEAVDNDDTSVFFHSATDDTAVSLPMKITNNDAVCLDGNESVADITEQNPVVECEPEDAETNAHSQDNEHQIHAEVGVVKDGVQTDVVNDDTAETEATVEEEPSSIVRDLEMPTFRIRQRIAMKVAAKKTAKGYLVSDERCDLCEMPLLSMNGNLSCKVCPAIEKWAQKKSEARLSIEFVDAHDTFESAEKQSESREDGLDGRDDAMESVGPTAESGSDSIGKGSEGTDANDSVQDIYRDEHATIDNEVIKVEEPILSPVSMREGIEMPTFRIRQRIAMKITAKKTIQGYLVSDKRCDLCEMPLLSMNDILTCKVCPAIEKWARKKKNNDSVSNEDTANMTVVPTLKEAESCDHELVDFVYRDETSKPNIIHAINETAPLANDEQLLSPKDASENECQDDVSEKMISQKLKISKVEEVYDALSPCSILTSPGSFRDDEELGENGMGSTADEVIANVQNNTSPDCVPPAAAMPLLLNQIKAVSLVDDEAELEEKCSDIKVDDEIEADVTASAVYEHNSNAQAEVAEDDVKHVVLADTTSNVVAENIPFTDDHVHDEKISVAVETEATNEVELNFLGSAMFQSCDDNTFHELQKAKFELKGMLDGCKLDLMTDTVDKLRSIFNCNVGEADDFRSMFVDERNQSFEYDEQTTLLVMRGWMVTNAHCRRCSKACMILRPVDGEMICPKCDDVESGPAVIFPSYIESTMQHAPIEHPITKSRDVVPSQLNKWTTVDRACLRCSRQLMRNPNLETDHCPTCGPVLTTALYTVQAEQSLIDTSTVQQTTHQLPLPPPVEYELATEDGIDCNDDTKENDILDANMLKELRETMKQIEEAKQFLLSRRTPRMTPLPPPSNKSLQQMSPALMQKVNMPSSARAGILKPSGYSTPQLNKSSGHQTPQLPGKIFFA